MMVRHSIRSVDQVQIWSTDEFLFIDQGDNRITIPIGSNAFAFMDDMSMMEDMLFNDVEP